MVPYVRYTDNYGKEVIQFKETNSVIIRDNELMIDRQVINKDKLKYTTLHFYDEEIDLAVPRLHEEGISLSSF